MKIIKENKILLLVILFLTTTLFGCMNDMEHQGNWSSPVVDENYVYAPSDKGKIYKFSKKDGSLVKGWEFPSGDNSLGSFYGEMIINDGILYGSAYGNGEGKKCQNRKCVSSLFGIDVTSGASIWMEEYISINGSVVGGVVYHNNTIYVATSENDKSNDAGGYLYAIDSKSDSNKTLDELTSKILWRIPLTGEVYGAPFLDEDQEILIIGGLNGDISLIDISIDDSYDSNSLNRLILTREGEYPVISSAIKVSEDSYCYGDIKGKLKCFQLSSFQNDISEVNGFNYWGELALDGWIWSDIETYNNSYYAITLSGWLYRIDIDPDSELISILWDKELKFDGKPVAGLTPYSFRNQVLLAVPFDKDKIIIIEDGTGSTLGEYPLKNGVQSLPIVDNNLIFIIDRENNFRSYSVSDRSQIICFDLNDMKGCD